MANEKAKTAPTVARGIADASLVLGPEGIEAEKLRLDIERLKLEKERLESGVASASSRYGGSADAMMFKMGTVCVVAAVCLLLGGIIGFSTGMDIGVRRSPIPRKILVSKQFIRVLEAQNTPLKPAPRNPAPWIPRKTHGVPSNLIIIR